MKHVLKVCAALLLCLACTYSASACTIPYSSRGIEPIGSTVEIVSQDEDSVTLRKTDDSAPFKILMFTDLHLAVLDKKHSSREHVRTLEMLVKNIQREKPDLVLFGGDNVTSRFNFLRSHQFARILEKLGVYWGGIIGNHEGDNIWSIRRSRMVKIFSSYDHCIMRQGKADVDGDCNYSIRILNKDGSLRHAFFCLDTFDGMSEEMKKEHGIVSDKFVYDVIKQSQIDWYSAQVQAMKRTFGAFTSAVLIHVPLTQFADAAALVEQGKAQFLYGDKREGVCAAGFDSGMFAAIKDGGVTQTVFCGHDHLNNFGVLYDGITLSYIEPSGYGAYGMAKLDAPESEWLQGYTRLLLGSDGTYTHEQFRNSAIAA